MAMNRRNLLKALGLSPALLVPKASQSDLAKHKKELKIMQSELRRLADYNDENIDPMSESEQREIELHDAINKKALFINENNN